VYVKLYVKPVSTEVVDAPSDWPATELFSVRSS